MTLKLRRGTNTERQSVVFSEGELIYITDTKELYAGDGSTLGGVKVSNIGSPAALETNLNLNGYNIYGTGSITATSFIGDGSQLTNLPSGGVVPGSTYKINVSGTNIPLLVDSTTDTLTASTVYANSFNGSFKGDGSQLTNVPGTIIPGASYEINIVGSNSSVIVDAFTNHVYADVSGSIFAQNSTLFYDAIANRPYITDVTLPNNFMRLSSLDSNSNYLKVISTDNFSKLVINKTSSTDLSTSLNVIGRILFERTDINGSQSPSTISAYNNEIVFGNDPTGQFSGESYFFVWSYNNFGIGTLTPTEKLDVNGNALIRGDLTANAIKGTIVSDNSTIFFDGITGEIVNFAVKGTTTNTPTNTATPNSWLEVLVNGATRYIPLYA